METIFRFHVEARSTLTAGFISVSVQFQTQSVLSENGPSPIFRLVIGVAGSDMGTCFLGNITASIKMEK